MVKSSDGVLLIEVFIFIVLNTVQCHENLDKNSKLELNLWLILLPFEKIVTIIMKQHKYLLHT